jgi:signal transduction histidine kinase/DNA-binding response OmpR family regulator/HPt (histidine-containing phosphotransfer) domain-containing protein
MRLSIVQNLPIKRKLLLLIIGITGGALLLFALLSAFTQIRIMRQTMVENLLVLSQSVAEISTLSHNISGVEGTAILSTLSADPGIELAVIYDEKKTPVAVFQRISIGDATLVPKSARHVETGFVFLNNAYKLEISCPIKFAEDRVGTLYVLSNTDRLIAHIRTSVLGSLFSLLFVLVVTAFASSRLQYLITEPVSSLAALVRRISGKGDYAIRVKKSQHDEIGQLIDDFNTMLKAIQDRDEELQNHRQNLENLVLERTEELQASRDEALAAARAKSEFLANMSHEIRTPMNGVIGVLSLLRDAPMTEEYRRLLDTATRSADSLLLIINDILDFSKIDAGKITFESIPFDLRELLEETSELFIDTVNLKNIDLTCFVPTTIPCRVKGDPTRLRQIITNLLSNAVKFTDAGEVRLHVSVVSRADMHQELLFSVEDTGIGIQQEAIDRLFDKFTQADGSTTRKYGGSGLGLSVCKQLVEKQGGRIGLKSKLGFGAMFWFTLPFVIAEDSVPVIPYNHLQGKHILLVDHNITNLAIIAHYLHYCDARVTTCTDAEGALRKLEEIGRQGEKVDTVLIDNNLGTASGLDFPELLHRQLGQVASKIILMSTTTYSRARLKNAGVSAILLKPVRQLELYNILAGLPFYEKEDDQSGESGEGQGARVLEGVVLLVDDEPINQKIAVTILQKFGLTVEVAATGYEAVAKSFQKKYSVILMDIQMPEMSGYEATELIRNREKAEGLPRTIIIAMTANAMDSTRKQCLAAGMDDFFTKPIKPDMLAERLQPWLSIERIPTTVQNSDMSAIMESAEQLAETQPGTATAWDIVTALGFVGGDEELFKELVDLFLQRNEILLSAIESAVHHGDALAVRNSAHAYKGSVSHFAAMRVRELAYILETHGKNADLTGCNEKIKELREAASILVKELTEYLRK